MALCWSLDKIGPICRYAEDTALVLAELNGHDPSDVGSLTHGFAYDGNQPLSRLTVGYDPRMLEAPETTASDQAAFKVLKASGVKLVELEFPELPWDVINPILEAESAAAFETLTLSGADDEMRRQVFDAWPNFFRISHFTSAVSLVQCDRIRRLVMEQLHSFFAQSDVFFAPSSDEITALTNLSGHPTLALRAGFEQLPARAISGITEADTSGPAHAVPDSVHLWSGLFQEGNLITLGRALEEALSPQSGWGARRPDLGNVPDFPTQ
jgi:Asp-tRNA(Asn)/Glu-tRNA(Gln) amidotransferase A subunit family amidase